MQLAASPSRHPSAFTLIELLVSMAVLLVLTLAVTQLTNQAGTISSHSRDTMDTANQARATLDRVEADLLRMFKRKDVNYIFARQSTGDKNDAFYFYAENAAYFSGTANANGATNKSSLALLGYRISTAFQLERFGKSLSWDGNSPPATGAGTDPGAVVFLTYPTGSSTPLAFSTLAGNWPSIGTPVSAYKDGQDLSYQVMGSEIFRLETCFQIQQADGTLVYSTYPTLNTLPLAAGSVAYDTASGSLLGFPTELKAVVITVALLDAKTRARNPGLNMTRLAATLPKYQGSSASAPLPGEAWQRLIDNSTLASAAGISQTTAGNVRVYQRVSYVNMQ